MSIELVKEKIALDTRLDKEISQILLEGDIIVPDTKPDMAVILKADPNVGFDKVEVSQDRVNFVGGLSIQVLYLAKGAEKLVHSIKSVLPIDDIMNVQGVTKDMWVDANGIITNFEYKMLNDRKISYKAVIDISIDAQKTDEQNVVVNISNLPKTQLLKNSLSLNKTIENKEDRFIVKDELALPSGKPNVRELLQYSTSIANKEVKVANGKVSINGDLIISTLYKGDGDESIIEFVENEVPFNGAFEISGAREGMFADVILKNQGEYIQVRPDSDGEDRILDVEISIGATIKVSAQEEIEILEDAYVINKNINFTKQKVKYPKLVCRNRNQAPVKEIVQLPENCPNILQIFRVSGKAQLDEIKIVEDRVAVEGVIHTDILYVAGNDETPLYSYRTVLPFKQIIETRGAQPEMGVSIETSFDHVGFNMLSDREMELRFLVTLNTQVIEEKEMSMITDAECVDLDKELLDKMASMTIYVVQKGDTLWKIAKRYNTSLEELVQINDIENYDKIYQGQKLLILKKVLF